MKSENYQELLEEYLEGDVDAEQELFARYDRDLQISPELWTGISERIEPVGKNSFGWWMKIAAVILLAIGLGSVFLLTRTTDGIIAALTLPEQMPAIIQERPVVPKTKVKKFKRIQKPIFTDNPGVLSTDLGAFDLDERETAKHIEQTENLLRSIRNFPITDTDEEIDVTYDKALSRRLLIENVVLRRDAEMKAKFPTKTLLSDLEPLLIDISNLPDHAKPEEVRAIKERVQKTEIVAALLDYQAPGRDRGPNNR
ncbi:MAG: hypothetical protein LC794_11630 [Acidobacteria bacterium]|nr:hypothetical protein [Acidobacteriota bacterium]MCA1627318.1 hypothetical protein [Acidobacteriota bacterium]